MFLVYWLVRLFWERSLVMCRLGLAFPGSGFKNAWAQPIFKAWLGLGLARLKPRLA